MCKFYYLRCETKNCPRNAQEFIKVCGGEPECEVECVRQPYFCGERWCTNCIRDGTYFAWKHLETQIRTHGIYQRWIATLRDGSHYTYQDAVRAVRTPTHFDHPSTSNLHHTISPPPIFTQLQASGLQPPALRFFNPHSGTNGAMFYSLPLGLQEQDLSPEEKETIPRLWTLTERSLEAMNTHRRALRTFQDKLQVFLLDVGMGKVPELENGG